MVIEAATKKKHSDLLKHIVLILCNYQIHTQPHEKLPNPVAQGYYDLYNTHTIVNVSNFVTGKWPTVMAACT